ncbi:protein kinase domain-containing protein [Leptolyngbya sp. AN02str]|uniref:protein kinase domain-containing protein n=1 Tax=Leptolyngbya sp. AN02str TaxID=3423363 RepID=UPI003D31B02A
MSYCLNPACPKPANPPNTNFCQTCGTRLRLGDRYMAYQPLGEGNSSRTFVGVDTQKLIDPRCIIKRYSAGGDEAKLRHDIARLAELGDHPQLPDVLAYFERPSPPSANPLTAAPATQQFLVQAFVEGQSLAQQLQTAGTFDEFQIRAVLRSVLPVLQYLHEHGVIHRDVKPANLIRPNANSDLLMLVDFGAVKFSTQSSLARTGTLMGSAEYAAPEQLMGKATFASDLYGLGTSCLQLITGLSPFNLLDSANGLWHWRSVAVGISNDLGHLLDRLVALNLSDRYQTAADVLRDLGGSPTQVRLAASWQKPVWSTVSAHSQLPPWQCTTTVEIGANLTTIALLPQSSLVAIASDRTLHLWDLERGEPRWKFEGHLHTVTSLAVTPDGSMLISGSLDRTLRLWDVKTGQVKHTFEGHTDGVTAIALDPGRSHLVSASRDKTLRLWDLESGALLHTWIGHTQAIEAIALHAEQQTLLSGDAAGTLKLWHTETRELLRTLPNHAARISAVAITADGQTTISGSWDVTVQLRQLHTGALQHTLTGQTLPVSAIALSSQRPLLAVASHDRTLTLWNIPTGKTVSALPAQQEVVMAIAFTPDNTLITATRTGLIQQWQTAEERSSN